MVMQTPQSAITAFESSIVSDPDEHSRRIGQYVPAFSDGKFSFVDLNEFASASSGHQVPAIDRPSDDLRLLTFNASAELQLLRPQRVVKREAQSCVTVCFGRSRRVILPADQRLMCFNTATGLCDSTPIDAALGLLSPRAAEIPDAGHGEVEQIPGFDGQLCRLTYQLGWWIGCVIGNGWVSSDHRVFLCGAIESEVLAQWSTVTAQLFGLTTSKPQDRTTAKGAWGKSRKISVSSRDLAAWVAPMVGHGAGAKHLPAVTFTAGREFQLGLIAGLFDTDGTIRAAKSGRFNLVYTTKSPMLCRQIAWLLKLFGVDSNFALQTNNFERQAWALHPSVVDFHRLPISFSDPQRNNVLALMRENPPLARERTNDVLPLSHDESETMCAMFRGTAATRKKDPDKHLFTLYVAMRSARRAGHIGRHSLLQIVDWLGDRCPVTVRERLETNLHWARVTEVTQMGPMDVLDVHFDDAAVAVVADCGIPVFMAREARSVGAGII